MIHHNILLVLKSVYSPIKGWFKVVNQGVYRVYVVRVMYYVFFSQ